MSEKSRLIKFAESLGDFYVDDYDGYVYYLPNQVRGMYSAPDLRAIADELDRRNADWDDQVKKELGQ